MTKILADIKGLTALQKATILLSLAILGISFTQPAFYIDRPENPAAWADSWLLFFLGWMSFAGGNLLATVIWLANPIYLLSIFLTIRGKRVGLYLSLLATLIAFSFSQLDSIMTSESGSYSAITSLEAGYQLWLTSFIIMTAGTAINEYLKKKIKSKAV